MNIDLIFSFRVWNKIKNLSNKERSRFLAKVRKITSESVASEQIKKIGKQDKLTIFRLRYNLNYRIIASLIKDDFEGKIIKIADFIPHKKLDTRDFYIEGEGNITIEDIKNLIPDLEDEDDIKTDNIWVNDDFYDCDIHPSYFKIEDDDFWSYTIKNNAQSDPDLILSSEQFNLITKEPNLPTLLTGSAGSGKTTIALYLALNHSHLFRENNSYQILYVTYNQSLTRYADSIIKRIYPEKLERLTNLDYDNLCRKFTTRYQLKIDKFKPANKINLVRFTKEFYHHRDKISNINTVSLWEEIRHLIKGSLEAIFSEDNIISFSEYQSLKHQSILSPNVDYHKVYEVAKQYQKWLKSHHYWDELDYTHYLLKQIPNEYLGEYNEIYCDEIQDLTKIQIKFLLKLLKIKDDGYSLPQIFFTGDPAQIINPSGFNWKEVKTIIWQSYNGLTQWENKIKPHIQPQQLTINFRSCNGIVNLGSAIVNLIKENSQKSSELITQNSWIKSQHKPIIINECPLNLFKEKVSFGIKNAIIVSDENSKESLAKYFPNDQERIMTIQDVKGLEFDEVLIWNFFTDFDSWQNRNNQAIKELNNFKFNCLYVCVTRARSKLYFYDDQVSNFFQQKNIKPLINFSENLNDLETLFISYENEEQMREVVEQYINQGTIKSYKIAMEILQKAGNERQINQIKALMAEAEGKWELAGEYWDKVGNYHDAFDCWQYLSKNLWLDKWGDLSQKEWDERGLFFEEKQRNDIAFICYQKSNNIPRQINYLENQNKWELVGDILRKNGQEKEAQEKYQLADIYYQENQQISLSAQMWEKLKEWEKSATLWENLKEWEKSAILWENLKEWEKSAILWEKVENWSNAQKCWEKLGKWREVALCCQYQQKWVLSAENWLKINEKHQAAYCYQQALQWDNAIALWQQLESWHYVAIALELQGKWSESAQIWEKVNPLKQKALCYEKSEEWEEAQRCWQEVGNWEKVAQMCEKQEKWVEAAITWEDLQKWELASKGWLKVKDIEKVALCHEKGGNWEKALEYWQKLGKKREIARCLEKLNRWQESAEIWEYLQEWKQAGNAWLKVKNGGEKAGECYEKGSFLDLAESCWKGLNQSKKLAKCYEKQGKWYESAKIWEELGELKQAINCYEKGQYLKESEKCWEKVFSEIDD